MTAGQAVLLSVALAAPVLGVLAPLVARLPWRAAQAAQAGATASAAAWVGLLVTGADGRVVGFHVSPLIAAGGCGAALLAVAALDAFDTFDEPPPTRAVAGAALALAFLGAGLAGGGSGLEVVALAAGVALATVVAVDATSPVDRAAPALLALAGILAMAAGAVLLRLRADRWGLPEVGDVPRAALIVLVGAATALVAAGTIRCRRPTAILAAGGLVLGLATAPLRPGADDLAWVAVVLALGSVAAAGAGRGPMALGVLALAAACASPGLGPASRLLAAAAVVAAAVDRPVAWLVAVPGGVALAAGVLDDGGGLAATALALAATAVAGLLTRAGTLPRAEGGPRWEELTPGIVPALLVGAWLVVAPGSWAWTGADLGAYDRGLARGLAAGVLVVVASLLAPELRHRPLLGPRPGPRLVRLPSRAPSPASTPRKPSPARSRRRPSLARPQPLRRLRRPGRQARPQPLRRLRRPGRQARPQPLRRLRRPGRQARPQPLRRLRRSGRPAPGPTVHSRRRPPRARRPRVRRRWPS